MKLVLPVLLLLSVLAFAEEQVPPTWTYSTDQLSIISQYGLPHMYSIVLLAQGPTRYESWFYFGSVRKTFGFSNGKKVSETPLVFGFAFAPAAIPPKQFTVTTTRPNLGSFLGPPTSVLPGQTTGVKQENLYYAAKGLSITLKNGKVTAVTSMPAMQ